MRVTTFLLALAIVAGGPRPAQADERGALLSGYTMTSWTLSDGVPIGPVYAVTQDGDGYLWLGTTGGIVRFDGARFTPWSALSSTALPRADVMSLMWSRSGTLWVGFGRLNGGPTVGALKDGVLTRVAAGTAPQAAAIAVLEDRAGRVWAVSNNALYRLRDGRWDLMDDGPIGRAQAVSLREDRAGAIWVGTRQGVFRTRDGHAFQLVDDGIARESAEGPDGTLWTTDPVHGVRRQGAHAPMTGIDGWGSRLLGDSQGNLWVGTTGQGLWRVRDGGPASAPLIERATIQTGLSSNAVQSLLEDRDGNIWVGTMLGLHSLTPQELTPLAAGALVRAILPDSDGSVWVGTANGLMHFREERGTWQGQSVGARWDIRSLSRDASGRAWAHTDHGLRALAQGRLVEAPRAVTDPPLSGPGTQPIVDAIFDGADGTRWTGSGTGLTRIRGDLVQQLGEADGLPAQRVMAITQGLDGALWLAVDRGPQHPGRRAAIVRLLPSDFNRAAGTRSPLTGYRIFDAGNGLAGVPLGTVTAACSRDGSLWFAFGGNLTVVNPTRASEERARASVAAQVVGVTIDNRAGIASRTPELAAGTRTVQIDYTALRLTAPRQVRFRYRLDGFDPEWVDAGPRRQAYYTNLAPGSYVFRVQANADGATWTAPEARWTFAVRPAFHQTAWFFALCAATLLLMAWGVAHTRVWLLNRQFAATLAERTRLSREIHDTMLQSLVGIALQVQAIARRCAPEAAEPQSQLVALRRQVEDYIREARQAIQNLRSPMLESCGLAGAMEEIGRRTVGPPTQFDVSAEGIAGLPAAVEGELLRIAQEAITNAARHAGAAQIRVQLQRDPEAVRLRVSDNGRGFEVAERLAPGSGHYGLTGMRERAARIGGHLTITSSALGTVVEARVPCAAARA